jgi:hypothetical protein
MIYYDGLFHDHQGYAVAIVGTEGPLTNFENGSQYLTCELNLKIKNYNNSPARRIANRLEIERLRKKFPVI